MSTWSKLVDEVNQNGFEKSSAMARLVWSCETENGIYQHASPDLMEVAEELEALRKVVEAAKAWRKVNPGRFENGLFPGQASVQLFNAVDEYEKGGKE